MFRDGKDDASAHPSNQPNTLYIDRHCHNDGLLEQRIETTSEVVSIFIR